MNSLNKTIRFDIHVKFAQQRLTTILQEIVIYSFVYCICTVCISIFISHLPFYIAYTIWNYYVLFTWEQMELLL